MRRLLTRFGFVPVTVARQFCRPTFGLLSQHPNEPNAWSPDEKTPVTLAPSPPHVAPGSSPTTPCATTGPELAVGSKLPPAKQDKKQADGCHPAVIHPPSLPTPLETFDRAVAELLGSERSKEDDVSDLFDPRQEALQAFDLYIAEYDRHVQEDNLKSLNCDRIRVPIACNFGASGSGKTSQLQLLCRHFRSLHEKKKKNAIIIYFSLNGKNSAAANVDSCETMDDRIALRILQGVIPASPTGGKYSDFYNQLPKKEGEKKDIPKGLLEHLPGLLRQLYGADLMTPILIAADELRKFGEEPPIGKMSRAAVDALKVLAELSQSAAISAHLKVGGPVYIAASAMAAYDPAKGITDVSGRPVYYMPLPPLGLKHYEAELLAEERDYRARTQRVNKDEAQRAEEPDYRARTIKRMLLWLHQGNARDLAVYSGRILSDKSPTEEKYQEALRAKGKAFSVRVASAAAAAHFNLIQFLRSLFFPLAFDPSTTEFHPQMRSALLGDAVGLCTLLRSTNPAVDSVYVHPVALSCLLSRDGLGLIRRPLPRAATVGMLCKLCTKLSELPVFPTGGASPHGTGKLYEEVVTYGYASKALLLRKSGTTVHEFLFGREPPDGMPEDFIGYRRIAHTPHLPIHEIARFPRASTFFDTEKEANAAGVRVVAKLNPNLAKTQFVYNAGCSALPTGPFVSILEDQYNVVIDSLLVLPGPDKEKSIAFGFQCKEYAASSDLQGALDHNRKKRATHLTYSDSAGIVKPFLESVDFVQVFVTPNRPTGPSGPSPLWGPDWEVDFSGTTIKCYEALVTHDDIRAWSPMVGYSGCDARVLKFSS